MATLVLGAAGASLAGPWGAAIGSMLGQSIDRDLFGQVRQGPRLGDLAVQTSQYGNQLPRIYGTMRVAGTVIWATDLQENGTVQSGGKGGPDTVVYAYSASFAVALSSRRAIKIKRIWADGNLLRGAAGDFKVRTGFRFYKGDEDQPCDPLIASIEGLDRTPAFRGLAVAVFDQLQLSSFGNRIPVVTFEVEADAADLTLGGLLEEASEGGLRSADPRPIGGYAAHGASILDAINPLVEASGTPLVDAAGEVRAGSGQRVYEINHQALGCSPSEERRAIRAHRRISASDLPTTLSLTYYDAERDYQAGEKHSTIAGPRLGQARIELPAVVTAASAQQIVEESLTRRWAERQALTLRLPLEYLHLLPEDLLIIRPEGSAWRVSRVLVEDYVVVAECVRATKLLNGPAQADAGFAMRQVDISASPTNLRLLDLPTSPLETDGLALYLAAAGGSTPWRAAPVRVEAGGVARTLMTSAGRAILGTVEDVLPPAGSCLIDTSNSVVVTLRHDEDWLQSCDDQALASGDNAAMLGSELIQYGIAEALGGRRFRLSRLIRGGLGSEWACDHHRAGESFCLLESTTLVRVDLPLEAMNTTVLATPLGLADDDNPTSTTCTAAGASLRPPSPAHLSASWQDNGDLLITWVRRTRAGFGWADGADPDRAQPAAAYKVRIVGAADELIREVTSEVIRLPTSALAICGAGPWAVSVFDISKPVTSRESRLTIPIQTEER